MEEHRIRIGVAGYGNVGRGVIAAIGKNPDTVLVAVFTRRPARVEKELAEMGMADIPVYNTDVPESWPGRDFIDVVILCGGSKNDIPEQAPLFARFYPTVSSFDTHKKISGHVDKLDDIGRKCGTTAVVSVGWDPGILSLMKMLAEAFLPGSSTATTWGPGVSQGHSDAARTVSGVLDARSYTVPLENAEQLIEEAFREGRVLSSKELHKRVVYIVAAEGADREDICAKIRSMPDYFLGYETEIYFISQEEMDSRHRSYPHNGMVLTCGQTGDSDQVKIRYQLNLQSNPGFTGSVLVACARAAFRLWDSGEYGAYTILNIPPALYSPYDEKEVMRFLL